MSVEQFAPGQRVTWLHEPRGGYGYGHYVTAVVVRHSAKRVLIRVTRVNGDDVVRWVTPEHLVRIGEQRP